MPVLPRGLGEVAELDLEHLPGVLHPHVDTAVAIEAQFTPRLQVLQREPGLKTVLDVQAGVPVTRDGGTQGVDGAASVAEVVHALSPGDHEETAAAATDVRGAVASDVTPAHFPLQFLDAFRHANGRRPVRAVGDRPVELTVP